MLQIQRLFIEYNCSVRREKIKYIVIHDVGEISSARNNRDYFSGGNRGSSADFFVDSTNIIQLFDYMKNYSWAVGDGKGKYGITNRNSVSIEMCLEKDYKPSETTIKNTVDLTKMLMKELNIPAENVVRHYDASRKNCPQSFSDNNWSEWNEFKKKLTKNKMIVPLIIAKSTPCIDAKGAIAKTFKPGDKVTAIDEDRGYWILSLGKIPKANCK